MPYGEELLAVDMGYVHGVSLADELDEVEGLAGNDSVRADAAVESSDSAPQTEQPAMPVWAQHMSAAGETGTLPSVPASPATVPPADAAAPSHRAPVICAVSGSGGCGKSTIVAAMAHAASLLGLRAAVLDLDLMFGNLYDLLGADTPHDMATLIEPSAAGALAESDIDGGARGGFGPCLYRLHRHRWGKCGSTPGSCGRS